MATRCVYRKPFSWSEYEFDIVQSIGRHRLKNRSYPNADRYQSYWQSNGNTYGWKESSFAYLNNWKDKERSTCSTRSLLYSLIFYSLSPNGCSLDETQRFFLTEKDGRLATMRFIANVVNYMNWLMVRQDFNGSDVVN